MRTAADTLRWDEGQRACRMQTKTSSHNGSRAARFVPGSHLPTGDPKRIVGEPSEVKSPIFIGGCHRSGTSMLRQILGSHPRISAGHEDTSLYWISRTDHQLLHPTLEACGYTEDEWYSNVRRLVEEAHVRYAESQGKTRWAIKAPENAMIIDYLDKLYPDCQVIHIVRDPRDVIASNQKQFGPNRGAFYGYRWARIVRAAETAGPRLGPERFRTVKYEDLVANPEAELKNLVEWLGEPWSKEVLYPGERTHKYPAKLKNEPSREITTQSIGKGRSLRSMNEDLRALLYVRLKANDLVEKFDYHMSFFADA
jgi:hypothetical protein